MNWSEYSRFVGDVFGAPLALEGLVAFFMESVFIRTLDLRLGQAAQTCTPGVHLARGDRRQRVGVLHHRGQLVHAASGRCDVQPWKRVGAELTSIWELLTNNTALAAFPHAVAGAFLTAATFVAGISGWWMVRNMRRAKQAEAAEAERLESDARTMYRPATRFALLVMIVAGIGIIYTGDVQGKLMFQQQPMKMASAESLCETEMDPDFSLLTIGTHNNCDSVTHVIKVPYVLSWLAEGKFTGVELQGVNQLPGAVGAGLRAGQLPTESLCHVLVFPRHDRPRRRFGSTGPSRGCGSHVRGESRTRSGSESSASSRFPLRSWRTVPAGFSPRWAVSPGWCIPIRPAST